MHTDHVGMPTVTRKSLDAALAVQFRRLRPGIVLDAGSSVAPYKSQIVHTRYIRLDINPKSNPDLCCDLHDIRWESDYFDTLVTTEVLEHLQEPQKAIDEFHRVLKPGGVCILSTRFIFAYHPNPKDYYRFTEDSLRHLFRAFSRVEVHPHGNRTELFWHLLHTGTTGRFLKPLRVFDPLILRKRPGPTNLPLGFVVWAEK